MAVFASAYRRRPNSSRSALMLYVMACAAGFWVIWGVKPAAQSAAPLDRVWFAPGPGTLDYLDLFGHPDEWPRARHDVNVFKFYQQHLRMPPAANVGPNSYDALVRADAFRHLTSWNIKIAIEVGAVKEFYCTSDASGMEQAIHDTDNAVAAVSHQGGTVAYLAMDEPWVSGRSTTCGGPALEPTADRVATYMTAVLRDHPSIRIGLIEAYPFSSADAIERMLQLLRDRGVPPAFLHMDVDWRLLKPGDFQRDLPRLQSVCASQGIAFGVIIFGFNGDADPLFAADAATLVDLVSDAFQSWRAMPQHIIFQSWAVSSTGLLITPSNLPEGQLYTHTKLLFDFTRRLHGTMGGSQGVAVPR